MAENKPDSAGKENQEAMVGADPGTAFQYTAFQQVTESRENM